MFGTIKRVFRDKGYFFIAPDEGYDLTGGDVFGYCHQLRNRVFAELHDGDRVTFEVTHDFARGNDRAAAVTVIE